MPNSKSNHGSAPKKGKLYAILRALERDEMRRFVDFVNSPYFNKNRSVARLLKEILRQAPDYPERSLSNESLYAKIFGNEKFNNQVMKNMISKLTRLAMEFMYHLPRSNKEFYLKISTLREFNNRKLGKIFSEEEAKLSRELGVFNEHPQLQLQLQLLLKNEIMENLISSGKQLHTAGHFLDAGNYLTTYFVIAMRDILLNTEVNRFSFNIRPPRNIAESFFDSIDFEGFFERTRTIEDEFVKKIMTYYYTLKINTEPDDEDTYRKFKKILYNNPGIYSKPELHSLFRSIESYCARKVNAGRRDYYKEMFDCYNFQMKNGFYKIDRSVPLTGIRFRNTYLTALRSGKTKWALDFISEFENEIIRQGGRNVVDMAYSHCLFEEGEYEKALQKLSKIRTSELYLKFDVRNIALMCHYELGNTETVLSQSKSYLQFIRNNKDLPADYAEKSLRFAACLQSLVFQKEKNDLSGLEGLLNEACGYAIDRKMDWIVEKIRGTLEAR
ncbi:MAG: hypothetical protein K1X85_01750 [Ignavibacteria bacterium]|nr:hypothetical protein [Ignavibacteria bacterium]